MENQIEIKVENGIDNVTFIPKGVCCKMMQMQIKDDILLNIEFTGGCSGNITGIGRLVKNMNINEIVSTLNGILCGKKSTSCPDQLTQGIKAYIEEKSKLQVCV